MIISCAVFLHVSFSCYTVSVNFFLSVIRISDAYWTVPITRAGHSRPLSRHCDHSFTLWQLILIPRGCNFLFFAWHRSSDTLSRCRCRDATHFRVPSSADNKSSALYGCQFPAGVCSWLKRTVAFAASESSFESECQCKNCITALHGRKQFLILPRNINITDQGPYTQDPV